MEWLEIIELRSAPHAVCSVVAQLEALTEGATEVTITIYRRQGLETDFSVHIGHESSTIDDQGSALGLLIAMALRKRGLVNHTVWVPNETGGTSPNVRG